MHFIYKKYGEIVEITKIEKEPHPRKVRVYTSRRRNPIYGLRRPDNIRRTRQICVRRVFSALEEYGCPLLVTLTFAGDASDASYANDSLRSFQVRLRTKYPLAQSLFIPELSPWGLSPPPPPHCSAFDRPGANILVVLSSNKTHGLTRFCAAFFGVAIIGCGAPIFCVIVKARTHPHRPAPHHTQPTALRMASYPLTDTFHMPMCRPHYTPLTYTFHMPMCRPRCTRRACAAAARLFSSGPCFRTS